MSEREKPWLIYDGECEFCRTWIERWKKISGDQVEYYPYQEVAELFPDINPQAFEEAVHLIDTEGRVYRAAYAVLLALDQTPWGSVGLSLYHHLPGFGEAAENLYAWVAKNRKKLSHWL